MAPPADSDHAYGWKAYAKEQEQKVSDLEQRLASLEKAFKRKSERRKKSKLPPAAPKQPPTREETNRSRSTAWKRSTSGSRPRSRAAR